VSVNRVITRILSNQFRLSLPAANGSHVWANYEWLQLKRRARPRRVTKGTKKKAIPLQTWAGPEGSKRLKLPDFKTIGT